MLSSNATITQSSIVNELVTLLNDQILSQPVPGLDGHTPLLEMGIVDSLSMISLLAFIQKQFQVYVPDEEVLPDNFVNLQAMAQLVARLQAEQCADVSVETQGDVLSNALRLLETSGIQRQWVMLDSGERMHSLRVSGKQPTWVLLPGLGNPSSSWGKVLQSLMDEHEAIAVDLGGFGLSVEVERQPNYRNHVRMVIELLEKTTNPPYILVGSSAGALVATEISRYRPGWVHALVIVGFGLVENVAEWWDWLFTISRDPKQFLNAAYYRPPQLTEGLEAFIQDVMNRPAYSSFLENGGFAAIETAFDEIHVPTLFVAGQADKIIPQTAVLNAVERVPQARLEWLARCGHFPSAEQPEELLFVIQQFLKSLDKENQEGSNSS
jgi:2-hydroxymuconate-semialdehyde hydrolase